MKPVQTAIGIGGNLGDRTASFRRAVVSLQAIPALTIVKESSWYETQPIGNIDQPLFLNAVLIAKVALPPEDLLYTLLNIESQLGRIRSIRDAPRTIDLDILLYGDHIIERPGLTIPHPRLTERAFVLAPLAEVLPDAVHPVWQRTIRALLKDLGRIDHLVSPYP